MSMTPTEQIAALGTALRQMREALWRIAEQAGPCPVCASQEEHLEACELANSLPCPLPSPADLATLARWAEIGRLVEMMHSKCSGDWGLDSCGPTTELAPTFDVYDHNGDVVGQGPSPLSALRAALEPEAKP